MNISPTPRRYTSRTAGGMGNSNAYIYSDPINREYNGGMGGIGAGGENGERILPEEYKLNSQMISRLIKQNKELGAKLDSKQEEIDRLNILVGSLRGKLIKYTEINKKLEDSFKQGGSRVSSGNMSENERDYIQVPKRRADSNSNKENVNEDQYVSNDDRISAMTEKLDKLTRLVLENNGVNNNILASSPLQSPSVVPLQMSKKSVLDPSEEDIMCRESSELKQMEDQIDSLKRKLLIKRENELRKISLNQELLELMDKLSMQNPSDRESEKVPVSSREAIPLPATTTSMPNHNSSSSPEYCVECHHQQFPHRDPRNNDKHAMRKSNIPSSNPLETPTPLSKRPGPQSTQTNDLTDTINRIW